MYVDESGDTGLPAQGSPTDLFCLTGLVVHESNWIESLKSLKQFRYWLKSKYGIYLEEELHAAEMIRSKHVFKTATANRKHVRLAILRHHADQIAKLSKVRLINVYVDKTSSTIKSSDDVFRRAWFALFQRFENTIRRNNFPGPRGQYDWGIVFPDNTKCADLAGWARQRVPSRRSDTATY